MKNPTELLTNLAQFTDEQVRNSPVDYFLRSEP